MNKNGMMNVNTSNPFKEIDHILYHDIYELKYIGQVNEETGRPEGLGIAIKTNSDYQTGYLLHGMFSDDEHKCFPITSTYDSHITF